MSFLLLPFQRITRIKMLTEVRNVMGREMESNPVHHACESVPCTLACGLIP